MLIRFIVQNVLSFDCRREFNLLPAPRFSRLKHHKYKPGQSLELLKMSAIYGANGAGKSNLVMAMSYLREIVTTGDIPARLGLSWFRLDPANEKKPQLLAAEFFTDGLSWLYAIEINNRQVTTEELYQTSQGKRANKLIFSRDTNAEGKTHIQFFNGFDDNPENKVLRSVIEKTLAKPDKPVFNLLSNLDNEQLGPIRSAYKWFRNKLKIIIPYSRPITLAYEMEKDNALHSFANEIMASFNTGVNEVIPERKTLKEFAGNNKELMDKLLEILNKHGGKLTPITSSFGEPAVMYKEGNQTFVTRLSFRHLASNKKHVKFYLENESDGTARLLDYIPAFWEVIHNDVVYVIDEIERSLHPLIIKEILKKISEDKSTRGQLVFTTHESNILDQELLRQDEIWFAEKDKKGCTDLYPLSDFKEHHTKDIEKGYLNGRYGGIPFLGNLKDLKWDKHEVIA